MPRFTVFFATLWRTLPRAATIASVAIAIAFFLSEASFAHGSDDPSSTVEDAAAESATNQATQQATELATEAASEKATEAASEQATEDASEQAAEDASEQAAEQASDQASEKASKQAEEDAAPKDSSGEPSPSDAAEDGSSGKGENKNDTAVATSNDDMQNSKMARAVPVEVTLDLEGNEIRAREIVVLLDRKDENAVRKAGFEVIAQVSLDSLGGQLLRIRVPDSASTPDALHAIQVAAPEAIATTNHVYRTADGSATAQAALKPARTAARPAVVKTYDGLAGIIDTPVERTYPGLGPAVLETRSFADGASANPTHGTAVADIIARQNVAIVAANVFAKDIAGANAATTDTILNGLNWLVSRGVTVINMSIEGPRDAALNEAVRRAQARGCIVVAAAGNKGPAAPPVYPAAFPSVVAVTAIDKQDRVYRYANQGPYISFAALGVDVETAMLPDGRQKSSGTSYSAPVVSALIARLDHKGTVDSAKVTLALLAAEARHLGPPGRNPVFGLGALNGVMPAYIGD